MWCRVIIILVLGREGIGSFVSRLEDVRIIYLWLTVIKSFIVSVCCLAHMTVSYSDQLRDRILSRYKKDVFRKV